MAPERVVPGFDPLKDGDPGVQQAPGVEASSVLGESLLGQGILRRHGWPGRDKDPRVCAVSGEDGKRGRPTRFRLLTTTGVVGRRHTLASSGGKVSLSPSRGFPNATPSGGGFFAPTESPARTLREKIDAPEHTLSKLAVSDPCEANYWVIGPSQEVLLKVRGHDCAHLQSACVVEMDEVIEVLGVLR